MTRLSEQLIFQRRTSVTKFSEASFHSLAAEGRGGGGGHGGRVMARGGRDVTGRGGESLRLNCHYFGNNSDASQNLERELPVCRREGKPRPDASPPMMRNGGGVAGRGEGRGWWEGVAGRAGERAREDYDDDERWRKVKQKCLVSTNVYI